MSKTYDVGYGKPPRHTRWKKGHSGNPKGRCANNAQGGQANIESLIRAALGKRGASNRTQVEELVRALIAGAREGNPKLLKLTLELAAKVERRRRRRARPACPAADEEALKALYARLTARALSR